MSARFAMDCQAAPESKEHGWPLLRTALDSVLGCPQCNGSLAVDDEQTSIRCTHCQRAYPVRDGIPILLNDGEIAQKREIEWRNALAGPYLQSSRDALLDLIGEHQCVPVMRKHAERFKGQFASHEWILDLGVGLGWHWSGHAMGANVLGVDASLGNLLLARRVLGDAGHRVTLVCADAAALPIRDRSVSGLWSVQVFQHFPAEVLSAVLTELHRILHEKFAIEIYNLNPALFLRAIYRLCGKRLHCRGSAAHMELNRLSPHGWADVWKQFRGGNHHMTRGYSELFFHPDLRFRPQPYPTSIEAALVTHAPYLAGLFARQGQVRIEASSFPAEA